MAEDLFVYDKITGHLYCKHCGNNYLLHEHKEDCLSATDDDLPTRFEGSD